MKKFGLVATAVFGAMMAGSALAADLHHQDIALFNLSPVTVTYSTYAVGPDIPVEVASHHWGHLGQYLFMSCAQFSTNHTCTIKIDTLKDDNESQVTFINAVELGSTIYYYGLNNYRIIPPPSHG